MAIPAIIGALRAVASVTGRSVFSAKGAEAAASAGASSALTKVRSALRKTVRDQASNLRTARRYPGVTSLTLDESARKNFNYDELADRVLKGESPNVAAREMLFRDATQLKLGNTVLTGNAAMKAVEEVAAWNRGVQRLRNSKGFTAGGIKFAKEDLEKLAGKQRSGSSSVFEIDTKYMQGTGALDTLRDTTPRELVVSRDAGAREAYLKGLRSAGLPVSLQGAIMDKVNALSPGSLSNVLRSLPSVRVAYLSSEIAMKAQLRNVLKALQINENDYIEDVERFENM